MQRFGHGLGRFIGRSSDTNQRRDVVWPIAVSGMRTRGIIRTVSLIELILDCRALDLVAHSFRLRCAVGLRLLRMMRCTVFRAARWVVLVRLVRHSATVCQGSARGRGLDSRPSVPPCSLTAVAAAHRSDGHLRERRPAHRRQATCRCRADAGQLSVLRPRSDPRESSQTARCHASRSAVRRRHPGRHR